MEFLNNLISYIKSEYLYESFLTILIAIIGYYIRRFQKYQKRRDLEQDRINRERELRQRERDKGQDAKLSLLISTIKNRTEDESEFFNQQRLIAYPLIRSVAQQARDEAKKITAERVIQDYKLWTQELCERYNRVLDTFYDNISLLEHFNHYHYVHTFKNELLSFYLKTIELNPKKKKNLEILKTELVKLLDSYQQIVKNIRQLDEPESITKSDESN